ncbi:MAG: hypothetical protein A3J35_01050 [Gammaproteobacteria bacterium RIFCSPLOWO2_02_FULL_52_10]|nr:MAG: hypothetical protein A3J35_01050 [Gammaproteobacteria bacterium RIFCSPLOWO2_02_FULL_52_10]OGT83752.1 MAG: hypothetical protein A3G96_04380 [Gammaproteobacteria bacterium RIFCSPLOWO2_12_FULL_52_10]
MKIELDNYTHGRNRIKSYSAGCVVISDKVFNSSIILSPDTIIDDRLPDNVTQLKLDDLDQIIGLDPEVVLLGTGAALHFPEQAISAFFYAQKVGFEVMDTGAACRVYNILMTEDRRVVAALFMIETLAACLNSH